MRESSGPRARHQKGGQGWLCPTSLHIYRNNATHPMLFPATPPYSNCRPHTMPWLSSLHNNDNNNNNNIRGCGDRMARGGVGGPASGK